MQQLLYRLWMALAVSTLTINYSHPVCAKIQPSPKSIPNQVNAKPSTHKPHSVNGANFVDRSKQPWEVILAPQKSAPKVQIHSKKIESDRRQSGSTKLPAKAKPNRSLLSTHNSHIKDKFSSQGIEYLIGVDRQPNQTTDFSALNRWID